MTTTITLGSLRAQVGLGIGEQRVVGTFSGVSTNLTAVDIGQFEPDQFFNDAYIQDTAQNNIITGTINDSITRVAQWVQANSQYTFYGAFQPLAAQNFDSYEIHTKLSFDELRSVINDGIAFAGKALRQAVRDESNTLTANNYQIKPNYVSGSANSFFPGGVTAIAYEFWIGQSTRDWVTIPKATDGGGWYYLDDETIQLPQGIVDTYAGNPIRLSGYGPVATPITTNASAQVIATLDDDWMNLVLKRACVYQAFALLFSKSAGGERQNVQANMELALQQYESLIGKWKRRALQSESVLVPVGYGGWGGR